MINKIDKLIIDILIRICSILTSYSEKISPYEIYAVKSSVEEVMKNGNKG